MAKEFLATLVIRSHKPGMAESFDKEVERILDRAVLKAIEKADPATPFLTGDLRREKEVNEEPGERQIVWLMDYAAYQDKGTTHHSGAHFTDVAVQAGKESLVKDFQNLRIRGGG